MGIYSLSAMRNLVWHRLIKLRFIRHHTFQHCLDMFKLNKRAKRYNKQLTWIELNSSFLTCFKAGYKHRYAISLSLEFLDILSFPQLLRHKTDMVASYHVVPYLQRCYAWVVTSSTIHNYWKCYINVVTWTCSGFYWYIHTLMPSGVVHIYQSNPSLLCYNILMYVCMYVCM